MSLQSILIVENKNIHYQRVPNKGTLFYWGLQGGNYMLIYRQLKMRKTDVKNGGCTYEVKAL